MKKSIFYIFVGILLLSLLASGFYYFKSQKKFTTSSISAIPINSECVFRFSSIDKFIDIFNSDNSLIKNISNLAFVNSIKKSLFLLDSLSQDHDISLDRSITCIVKLFGKSDVCSLFVLKLDNYNEQKTVGDFFDFIFKTYSKNIKTYSGEKIICYSNGKKSYRIAFVKGLLIVSESSMFVEDAIRQMKSETNLLDVSSFVDVQKTIDKGADVNFFINNSNISKLVNLFGSIKFSKIFSCIDSCSEWTGIDIDISDNSITANGFSSSNGNKFELFDVLSNQVAVESELINSIPANLAAFSLLSLSDVDTYRSDMIKYRGKLGKLTHYRRGIANINKILGCKIENVFYSFFSGEAAVFSMSINSVDLDANKMAIFKSLGNENLKNGMLSVLSKYAKSKKRDLSYFRSKVKIDRDLYYEIYELPVENIPYSLFGNMFYNVPAKYFVVVNNNLVFGGSVSVLSDYLNSTVRNKSINDDVRFKECKRKFSDKSNFMMYVNTVSSMSMINNCFRDRVRKNIIAHRDDLDKFYAFGLQLSSANSMVYSNSFLLYSEKQRNKPQTIWESGLDANVAIKPSFVKNHNTGETEIFVQDKLNNIYLISSKGRVLWKLPIKGRINSEIYQVDMYRNKKLQYLFSTKSRLYLIDRNGDFVSRYPIKFKSSTKRGITVYDYDKTRNYRIFVPSVNKKIYLYDIKGNIVKGWKSDISENEIISKVQYYRVGKKDFIAYADKYKFYLLNRKGKKRARTTKYLSISNNEPILVNGRNPHVLITDTKACVFKVFFDGRIVKIRDCSGFSEKHYFVSKDLDGDGYNEYILVEGNKLCVYNRVKKIFEIETEGEISLCPNIYEFSYNNIKIGLVNSVLGKVYLINSDGTIYDGYPLQGIDKFSIGFMSGIRKGFYMFVGSKNKGLYKYRVIDNIN